MIPLPSSWPEGWTEPEFYSYPERHGNAAMRLWRTEMTYSPRRVDYVLGEGLSATLAPSVVVRHLLELAEKHPNGIKNNEPHTGESNG